MHDSRVIALTVVIFTVTCLQRLDPAQDLMNRRQLFYHSVTLEVSRSAYHESPCPLEMFLSN